jgi:hypothetical protein
MLFMLLLLLVMMIVSINILPTTLVILPHSTALFLPRHIKTDMTPSA